MDFELTGKTALITGGSRGIGLACARELALEGVDVAIAARTEGPLKQAAQDLAKEAYQTGRTIRDLARERTSLSDADLDRILDPAAMVEPGRTFASAGG